MCRSFELHKHANVSHLFILFLVLRFGRTGKFWGPEIGIFYFFNEMPTMCDSNKEGGSVQMWLSTLALGSECQGSSCSTVLGR